ncbi:hypothetical protein IEO21_06311 [Rhodonia placenta]|uniref:HMG box domain-containing protein n=1 Tax=Rhodonia placenta TaxID=104341 RepID=A0A8H7P0J9_9APHY|nr:hypothetical protein IEO21_06311 [Postia placenta]
MAPYLIRKSSQRARQTPLKAGIKEFDHCDLQDLHPSSPFASGTQSLSSSSDTLPSSPPSSAGSPDYCPPSPSLSSGSSDYEPSAPPRRSRKPSPRKKASARNRQDSHKNPASGRVRRPPNAFIIFRSNVCKKTKVKGPAKKNNQTTTSCAAAILWNSLSDAEKAPWATRAAEAKAQHKLQHPDYKYTPGKAHKAKSGKRGPRPTKLEISRSETMAKLLGQGFEGAELNRHLELIYGEANSPLPSSSRTRGPHVSQSTSKRATKSRTTKVSDFEGDFQPEVAFENMHISDMATPELVASSPESDDGQLPQEVSTPSSSVSHEVQGQSGKEVGGSLVDAAEESMLVDGQSLIFYDGFAQGSPLLTSLPISIAPIDFENMNRQSDLFSMESEFYDDGHLEELVRPLIDEHAANAVMDIDFSEWINDPAI